MNKHEESLEWFRVAAADALPEGRVKTVTAGTVSLALTHIDGEFNAMDNRCPHQGGPLGEGSIEVGSDGQCWLRCPWHGWDFDPKTGLAPGGHEDSGQRLYPVEVREDGIYVGLEAEAPHATTVTDVMAETMTNWGVTTVFGMVGHSNLGLADALRLQEKQGRLSYLRYPSRRCGRVCLLRLRKAHRQTGRLSDHRRPGRDQPDDRAVGCQGRPRAAAGLTGQVDAQVLGPGAFQEDRPRQRALHPWRDSARPCCTPPSTPS